MTPPQPAVCDREGCRNPVYTRTGFLWLCYAHFAELTKGVWHH